jgi:hydroxyacylglutathione hydrolase
VTPHNDGAAADGPRLYFRQLLSGRDFAVGDPVATQMVNFAYLIGDRTTGECLLVDPAYAVGELLDVAAADGMRVTGVLATHYHADHIGGSMMGLDIEGIAALLERQACPIHVQRAEVPWVVRTTGLTAADVIAHDPGDIVAVGAIDVELVHTPGHTPGSQCFLVDGRLVSGDTLFLDGCGRTDLPGSDPSAMAESLNRLARFADDVILYPGHRYSMASSALMGSVKASNWVFDQLANQ